MVFGRAKCDDGMASEEVGKCETFYSDIKLMESGFSSYKEEPGPVFSSGDPETSDSVLNHFTNFIECVRSRRWQDLNADILEGHLSSSLCHLGNIACRLKRTLRFNAHAETFVNDSEADSYLSKNYRSPYTLPHQV